MQTASCILMYITRNTNHQSTWRSNDCMCKHLYVVLLLNTVRTITTRSKIHR